MGRQTFHAPERSAKRSAKRPGPQRSQGKSVFRQIKACRKLHLEETCGKSCQRSEETFEKSRHQWKEALGLLLGVENESMELDIILSFGPKVSEFALKTPSGLKIPCPKRNNRETSKESIADETRLASSVLRWPRYGSTMSVLEASKKWEPALSLLHDARLKWMRANTIAFLCSRYKKSCLAVFL